MTTYEFAFYCPDLKTQADLVTLREYLAQSPGIDTVEADIQTHRIHVTTAAQDAGADVRLRLSQAGFPPEE